MLMPKPNILVYNTSQAEIYAQYIRGCGFSSVVAAATPEEAAKYLPNIEVVLGWEFPTQLLKDPISSSVLWFQSAGAGVDDLIADKSIPENIILTRVVDQFGGYISEYIFTYLLYILKDVPRMRKSQLEQRWDPFISESLAGKTIGVAGLGSIGKEIIRKARAFDMNVYGLSYRGEHAHLTDRHFTQEQLRDFVEELDYLVLSLPLTEFTHHMINRDILYSMKAEACLFNVGRGSLIDEKELLTVMQSGHLKAAVLDVFETEPLPKNHGFYSIPNIYLTSHLSGPSIIDGVSDFFIENLTRYLNHQPLKGVVDRKRGY